MRKPIRWMKGRTDGQVQRLMPPQDFVRRGIKILVCECVLGEGVMWGCIYELQYHLLDLCAEISPQTDKTHLQNHWIRNPLHVPLQYNALVRPWQKFCPSVIFSNSYLVYKYLIDLGFIHTHYRSFVSEIAQHVFV